MKIIIVGCGRIGSGLARLMCKNGHTVTVIDSDASAFKQLGSSFTGKTVEGIGFDRNVLAQADIRHTDAVAAVTSSDESNAVIVRIAREVYRVPKVVARMYDRKKADIYKRLGVETLSSTSWGIKKAAELLSFSPLHTVTSLGSGDVDIVEVEIPSLLVGHKTKELMIIGEMRVVALKRGSRTFLPTMDSTFLENDTVYVAVTTTSQGQLKKLLGL